MMSSRNGRDSVEMWSSFAKRRGALIDAGRELVPTHDRGGAIDTESRPKADGSLTTSPVLVPIVVDMNIARTLSCSGGFR